MKRTIMLMMVAVGVMVIQSGCGSGGASKTGFLTDYSRLREESGNTLRYVNERALARYSNFMIDRVEIHFHSKAKSRGKLTKQEISNLTNYMHAKILEAVRSAGKRTAYQPAPGVARIRVALTDISKSSAASLLPQAKLAGIGIGGASMEAEIIDSMTGEQIGAVIETQKGSRVPLTNLGKWDAAEQVMDDWAKRFQKRLSGAR